MKSSRPAPPLERPATTIGIPHRLHPSSRRPSDASIDKLVNSVKTSSPTTPRDTRPPPSMRGFSALPQLAQVQYMQSDKATENSSSPASPALRGCSSSQSTPQLLSSRRTSSGSLPSLTPTSTRFSSSTPATPTRTVMVKNAEFTILTPSPRSPSLNFDFQLGQGLSMTAKAISDEKRTPRSTHYDHDPFIDSSVEELDFGLDSTRQNTSLPPLTPEYVVNVFPEPSSPPESASKVRRRNFSLSKGGSKLLKKRWSSSKTSAAPTH